MKKKKINKTTGQPFGSPYKAFSCYDNYGREWMKYKLECNYELRDNWISTNSESDNLDWEWLLINITVLERMLGKSEKNRVKKQNSKKIKKNNLV